MCSEKFRKSPKVANMSTVVLAATVSSFPMFAAYRTFRVMTTDAHKLGAVSIRSSEYGEPEAANMSITRIVQVGGLKKESHVSTELPSEFLRALCYLPGSTMTIRFLTVLISSSQSPPIMTLASTSGPGRPAFVTRFIR